jgi:hypothetical protein
LKKTAWILSLLLAVLLVFAFAQVPEPGKPSLALSTHITARYQQRGEMETGIHSQAGAVLADYRSFDLLAAVLLFSTAALAILLFFNHPPSFTALFPSPYLLVLGVLSALGVGFLCLQTGSNFLDFEALASWVTPPHARLDGALILLGGALLSFGGLLTLLIGWIRMPEGSSGR